MILTLAQRIMSLLTLLFSNHRFVALKQITFSYYILNVFFYSGLSVLGELRSPSAGAVLFISTSLKRNS